MTISLTVTEVIEDDTHAVLFKGVDAEGAVKTFHLRKDDSGTVQKLTELVKSGQQVQVEL